LITAHPLNCSLQSVRVVRVKGSTIVNSPQQRRPSVSQWKIFLQSARSGRGCRSETSASTARKSIASMTVIIIPCDAERVYAKAAFDLERKGHHACSAQRPEKIMHRGDASVERHFNQIGVLKFKLRHPLAFSQNCRREPCTPDRNGPQCRVELRPNDLASPRVPRRTDDLSPNLERTGCAAGGPLNEGQKVSSTLLPIERPASPRRKLFGRSDRHREEHNRSDRCTSRRWMRPYPVFRRETSFA
jgi:hypothetical protein